MSLKTISGRAVAASALAAAALFVAACGSSSSSAGSGSAATGGTSAKVAAKATVTATSGALGTYLTDASGRALYLWMADSKGMSGCTGECAQEWPPLTTKGKPAASGSASASALGTIKRSDGKTQVTYQGHPLYLFAGDAGAGKTTGQGLDDFGAKWWLVNDSGAAITKSSGTSGASAY